MQAGVAALPLLDGPRVLAAGGPETATLFLELGGVILALAILARLAGALRLSPIPFYLLVGLSIGEGGITELSITTEFIEIGSQIGVVLLLFLLGLEYSGDELVTSLRRSAPAGAVDLVLNFTPGVAAALLLGWTPLAAVVLGGVTYISSSGIIAKVLGDLGRTGNRETPSVLAILVIEDLAMAVYLPLVGGLLVGGTALATTGSVAIALLAVAVVLVIAVRFGPRISGVVFSRSDEALLFTLLGVTLVVAGLAESVQVSAAVGAFLVGIAISGPAADAAHGLITPLRDLFAGAFFVFFALEIDPADLTSALGAALLLAIVTAITKIYTGWWAARRAGIATPGRFRAGFALVARGEFSIVIAGLAVANGVEPRLGPLVAAYVLILAMVGPMLTRYGDPLVRSITERRATRAYRREQAQIRRAA
ncbi:MAG TPA: cation:proton antiporter [Acidimicrobiales bacterium]|nr:cation:proton antiporter [Acidimicrobiales bacterium]